MKYVLARESGTVLFVLKGRMQIGPIEYGGFDKALVAPGDTVKKNQPIGKHT